MVRELMHDPIFLARKSAEATAEDLKVARDLLDTLAFHKEGCVGMAANMIGVCKRIIVFDNEGSYMTMLNPVILKGSDLYANSSPRMWIFSAFLPVSTWLLSVILPTSAMMFTSWGEVTCEPSFQYAL